MSRNSDAVTAIYDAFVKGESPAILTRLDPDVAWEYDWGGGGEPLKWFEPRRGRDAVPGFFASLSDFEIQHFEPMTMLEAADAVAVPVRLKLLVKATGRHIEDLEMHLWTFGADGLVTSFRHFVDTRQWALACQA